MRREGVAGSGTRSDRHPRRYARAAQRLSSAETTQSLTLSTIISQLATFQNGQIYRTKNQSKSALRCADLWFIQSTGAKKLSARHARAERFPAQTIGVRDCARRKTEAALPIWASRAAISEDFREGAAEARCDR